MEPSKTDKISVRVLKWHEQLVFFCLLIAPYHRDELRGMAIKCIISNHFVRGIDMQDTTADQKTILELDKPLREALSTQKSYLKKLSDIVDSLNGEELLDDSISTNLYRLVLQHRLDKENVLTNLMRANKQLCLALGVEEHGTLKHNMDALITQLGTDSFFKELSLLGHLVDKLNKALGLLEQTKRSQDKEKALHQRFMQASRRLLGQKDAVTQKAIKEIRLENAHTYEERRALFGDSIAHELRFAAGLQAYFSLCVEQITEAYHAWAGAPKFGVVYDYLSGLKGPFADIISNVKEGINLTDTILQKLSVKLGIAPQKTVNQLFNQTNAELEHFYQAQKSLLHENMLHNNELKAMTAELTAALSNDTAEAFPIPKPKPPIENKSDSSEEMGWKRRTLNLFNRS